MSHLPENGRKSKSYRLIAAIAVAVVLIAALAMWLLPPSPKKDALVGDWQAQVPIGKVLAYIHDDGIVGALAEHVDPTLEMTVYCRFYENDTYTVYVDPAVLRQGVYTAVDTIAPYLAQSGAAGLLEAYGITPQQTELLLGLMQVSPEALADTVTAWAHAAMEPVYRRLESVAVSDSTGERAYTLENGTVYTALENDKSPHEGDCIAWGFDGESLRFLTGTPLDVFWQQTVWRRADTV